MIRVCLWLHVWLDVFFDVASIKCTPRRYCPCCRQANCKGVKSWIIFLCFAQLPTSTSSRSSIFGLSTKRLTSTLNGITYYCEE
ncbi:unnamed protein product [Tenebrio molitor]|nr:unnamed protein product [Tenebrio molitor]